VEEYVLACWTFEVGGGNLPKEENKESCQCTHGGGVGDLPGRILDVVHRRTSKVDGGDLLVV
jgi:hypothetical protein